VIEERYLMVSWHVLARNQAHKTQPEQSAPEFYIEPEIYRQHDWWDFAGGWKSTLNNLRLIIQPYVFFNEENILEKNYICKMIDENK